MAPRLHSSAAGLTVITCLLVLLVLAAPGIASPSRSPVGVIRSDAGDTPTATPVSSLYMPVIASGFVSLPTATATATATPTPTVTPTPTPTLPPACSLPAQRDESIALTVSPNRATALEQMVGKIPFTVNMTVSVSGGTPPYTYCWDVEPDGHRDSAAANPAFTFGASGQYNPLVVVIDAQGSGQYVGTPPPGSPVNSGGRP